MFILTTISDLVQIPPHAFNDNQITRNDLEDRINEKYSNRVIPKVGLCICMYDLLKASDGLIGNGNGNVNVNVEFRMMVFRPFKGEVITGIVHKCTPKGIYVTTQFFENIFVPSGMLFEDCQYNEAEKVWVWKTEGEEFFFDPSVIVNVRVEAEKWPTLTQKNSSIKDSDEEDETLNTSYSIQAAMDQAGLGGVEWW
ncbi:hypothetical protein B0A52_02531 [Exophiala mesophila]|uniref:DNA-directed RNA polymerase subunit n=1 Tax=Exophiala mesophila TaxID=212818 RepID=A0A438ND57_EXOME|nr:hypothetical protein B0A52_02531 [Exophiala mesophila]